MRYQYIFFDLDGTLWNATENIARSWNQVLLEEGYAAKSAEDQLNEIFDMMIN